MAPADVRFDVRIARAADAAAMHLVRGNVRENRLADPQQITEATYLPFIEAGTAWVAETEIGVVSFGVLDAPAKRVWALFIDPDAEGAGIGLALHHQMLAWSQEHGLDRLTLSTERGTRAARFYERAGWREAGVHGDGELLFEMVILT